MAKTAAVKRAPVADVDTDGCVAALKVMYKAPAFAFFEQVANGTGWNVRGWADGIAMGIWPSRGLHLHGFEIKVSRADWKKELDHPDKAERVQKYCDFWWIVTPTGLIETTELPPTWGLIEVSEKKVAKITVQAPKFEPEPVTRHFLAALLRRQHDLWDDAIRKAHRDGQEVGAKEGNGNLARRLEHAETQVQALEKRIKDFEDASGIPLQWSEGAHVGKAVRIVLDAKFRQNTLGLLERERESLKRATKALDTEIAELKKHGDLHLSNNLVDDD